MKQRKENLLQRIFNSIKREVKWLTPGLGVKRWLVLIFLGTTLIAVGTAILLLDIYRTAPSTWWLPVLSALSLRFIARPLRALVFGGIGISLIVFGIWGLNRSLLIPFIRPGRNLVEAVSSYRRRGRGPKIVVIGGGTGLATLLRGLKPYTNNLTAVGSVADDGGSSGELRKNIGILPPGDIRNCLAALSNDEELVTQLFRYRFSSGAGLEGHALGNLLITALTDLTGSFEEAISESGKVLAIEGRVLPATLHDVKLVADVKMKDQPNGVRVKGESMISMAKGRVGKVWLEPDNPLAYPPTIQAILSAEMIVVGPGSLYTSILPNLLVPDLAEAVKASKAVKFFVTNVATQPGETDGFSADDHIKTIEKILGKRTFDIVLVNNQTLVTLPEGVDWVKGSKSLQTEYPVYFADMVDIDNPWRHDSEKLAKTVMDLFYERTGPMHMKEGF